MIEKVNGLVIKTTNVKESDKYLIILTREYGKIIARASGVRNIKSKLMTATQLFSYSEFTLYRTNNFCKINEASIIENFYQIRLDVKILALASYITEAAEYVSVEGEDEDDILGLVLNTLYMLSYREMNPDLVKAVFEIKLMSLIGFMPNMKECELCSQQTGGGIYYFNYNGGNLICGDCFIKQTIVPYETKRIDNNIIKLISYIASTETNKVFSFKLDNSLIKEFSALCENYQTAQLAHKFKTLDYYKQI